MTWKWEVSLTAISFELTLVFSYSPNYPRVNFADDGKKTLLKLSNISELVADGSVSFTLAYLSKPVISEILVL